MEYIVSTVVPWVISAAFAAMILFSLTLFPSLIRGFLRLSWYTKLLLLTIILIGTYIRIFLVPNIHRIYYDEDRYLSYAATFARFGKATTITYANPAGALIGDPDQAIRLTVPVMHAWVLKFTGYNENNLFIWAKIISCIQIILIFILSLLLFQSQAVALMSAAGMALLPVNVFWSPSLALDMYFVFFALLAAVATLHYAGKPTATNGVFLNTAILLLLCVRIEAFAFLGILTWMFLQARKPAIGDIWVLGGICTIIALRAIISVSVIGQRWCCAEALPLEAFHLSYLVRNMLPNIASLFTRPELPVFIPLAAAIAVIQKQKRSVALLAAWIGLFFFLYGSYYAGMFYSGEFSGSYGRYFLILVPPLVILAAVALVHIKKKLLLVYLLILISIVPAARSYRQFITTSPYWNLVDEGPATIHEFTQSYLVPNTPNDALILTSIAVIPLLRGNATALYWSFFTNRKIRDQILADMKGGKRVFATAPYHCQVNPVECEEVAKYVDFTPVTPNPPHPEGVVFAELTLKE